MNSIINTHIIEGFIKNGKLNTNSLYKYKTDNNLVLSSEEIYLIYKDMSDIPKCECGNNLKFRSFNIGYSKFCSRKCSNNNKETIRKQRENTDWNVVGKKVSDILKNKTLEEKLKIKNQIKETCLKKYGDENYNNREKYKETCLKKYGVENAMQNKEIQERVKITQYTKYGGFFNPTQFKETNINKYGFEFPLQNKEIAKKFSKQLRIKYNSDKCKEGYVYIIYFETINLVKIGCTLNMDNRSKQLIKDFGKFNIISLKFYKDAYKKERGLHKKFDEYNIVLSEGVGKTEFFLPSIISKLDS